MPTLAQACALLFRSLPFMRPRCALLVDGAIVEADGSRVYRDVALTEPWRRA